MSRPAPPAGGAAAGLRGATSDPGWRVRACPRACRPGRCRGPGGRPRPAVAPHDAIAPDECRAVGRAEEAVAPDDPVAPDFLVAVVDRAVAPDDAVAPHQAIAPDHRGAPGRIVRVDVVAVEHAVAPEDLLAPRLPLAGDDGIRRDRRRQPPLPRRVPFLIADGERDGPRGVHLTGALRQRVFVADAESRCTAGSP